MDWYKKKKEIKHLCEWSGKFTRMALEIMRFLDYVELQYYRKN